jgi:hypothetical protein
MRNIVIVIVFCAVIIGVPTGAWAVGHAIGDGSCCPWGEFLNAAIQMAPLGVALGVIAALVVGAYERLLRAVEQQGH